MNRTLADTTSTFKKILLFHKEHNIPYNYYVRVFSHLSVFDRFIEDYYLLLDIFSFSPFILTSSYLPVGIESTCQDKNTNFNKRQNVSEGFKIILFINFLTCNFLNPV